MNRPYYHFFKTYVWPQRLLAVLLAIFLFTNIGLQLANPQLLRRFIDSAQAGSNMQELAQTAVFFILIAIASQLLTVAATYVSQQVAWRSTNALRQDLAAHCLQLGMSFHNEHTPGELIERIDGDVSALANFFSQFIILIVGNGLLCVGILVLLFREGWQVGLALTLFAIITTIVIYSMRDLATPHWEAQRQANATLFGFIEERLSATEDIRANGAIPYTLYRLHQLLQHLYRMTLKAYTMLIIFYSSSLGMFAIGMVIALGVGGYLLQTNVLTLGALYLIFHYTQMLQRPLEDIMYELDELQQATASLRRIRHLLLLSSTEAEFALQSPARSLSLRKLSEPAAVHFQDVSFQYNAQSTNQVLQNISFALPAGKTLGIVGRTGSGKSTLIRLLTRLYDPTSGTIRLGNQILQQLEPQAVRRRTGVVTQDVQLFQASLRDNLTFFAEGVPTGRLIDILNDVGLGAWFASLPNGLETMMGSGEQGLSAGQAQLLAFARVLLKEPQLVILDEASSRLDSRTESQLEQAIDKLLATASSRKRTAIIIAHRLHTIQRADYILVLENGRLLEYGPRQALAQDDTSRFYQLLSAHQSN